MSLLSVLVGSCRCSVAEGIEEVVCASSRQFRRGSRAIVTLDGGVVWLAGHVGVVRVDVLLVAAHVRVFRSLVLEVQLRDAVHGIEVGNDDVDRDVAGCADDESAHKCRRTLDVPPRRVGHEVGKQLLAPGSANEGAE